MFPHKKDVPRKTKTTIKDVAKDAMVSVATSWSYNMATYTVNRIRSAYQKLHTQLHHLGHDHDHNIAHKHHE